MELFFDGGLFEIILALGFAGILNFIFRKKILLIIFSVLIVAAPVFLFITRQGEVYYWIVSLCVFNSLLLVVLLWKQKRSDANGELFKIGAMPQRLKILRQRWRAFSLRIFH